MEVTRCPNCGTRLVFQSNEERKFYIIKENGEKELATHYCVDCDLAFNGCEQYETKCSVNNQDLELFHSRFFYYAKTNNFRK